MSCSPWQHLGSVTFACLHSFLFSLSYSTTPGFLAWVLHAVLPICHEPLCHQVSSGHWFPPLQLMATALLTHSSLCLACEFWIGIVSSKRWWLGPSKPVIILSSPWVPLFSPLKLGKPPICSSSFSPYAGLLSEYWAKIPLLIKEKGIIALSTTLIPRLKWIARGRTYRIPQTNTQFTCHIAGDSHISLMLQPHIVVLPPLLSLDTKRSPSSTH